MNTIISGNQLENIGTPSSDVIISGNQLENTGVADAVEISSEDELVLLNVPVGAVAYIIGGGAWQKSADGTWKSYGGGGGGSSYYTITNSEDSTISITIWVDSVSPSTGNFIADINIDASTVLNILNDYHYYVRAEFTTAVGSYEEVEINGDSYYHITGDVTFEIID